jgi:DNA-binding NarL/FixJ family response regulator
MSLSRPSVSLCKDNAEQFPGKSSSAITERGASKREALRVHVATDNRLLHEALMRVLSKDGSIEVVGCGASFDLDPQITPEADVFLLASHGDWHKGLQVIRQVRSSAPNIPILFIELTGGETQFLECVRAGVNGFLLRDASGQEVVAALRAVQAGNAVCPGTLCSLLLRHIAQQSAAPASNGARGRRSSTNDVHAGTNRL